MNFNNLTQKELHNLILNRRIEAKPSNKKMTVFFDDDDSYHAVLFRVLGENDLYKNLVCRELNEILNDENSNKELVVEMYDSILSDSRFMRTFFSVNHGRQEKIKIFLTGSLERLLQRINEDYRAI